MQQEIKEKLNELIETVLGDVLILGGTPHRGISHDPNPAIVKLRDEIVAMHQHPAVSNVWVKATTRLPSPGKVTWRWLDKAEAYSGFEEKRGFIYGTGGASVDPTYYSEIEWLDEQPVEQISDDVHEKEVMMQAFDNVRQIFERRNWIMEGRGSYPYNDDQYKEEVRYMYDEFDKLFKETWGNIKSKSYDYRQAIIAEYMKGEQKENDAVLFGEWIRFNKFRPFTEGRWIKFESGEILGTTKQLYNEYKRQSMISEMK